MGEQAAIDSKLSKRHHDSTARVPCDKVSARSRRRLRKLCTTSIRRFAERAGYRISQAAPYDVALYGALNHLRSWSPDDVVFDVGANDGRTIERLQRHLPSPRIFAFEPVAATYDVLAQQTSRYPNVERFQLALGNETGRRDIYLNESAALNSLYWAWGSSEGLESIEITTIDAFLSERALDRIHLLKVDTEGHDLEVLKGAEQALSASRVGIIMVEAGFAAPGRPQPALPEFQDYLRPFGYHLYGVFNQCRMSLGRRLGEAPQPDESAEILIYCDALFVNGRGVAD